MRYDFAEREAACEAGMIRRAERRLKLDMKQRT